MPNARPDPLYRPGGTSNYMPFYHNPQAVPQRPVQALTQAPRPNPDRVPEKPNMIDDLKERAGALHKEAKSYDKLMKDMQGIAKILGPAAGAMGTAAVTARSQPKPNPVAVRRNQPDPTGRALDGLFLNRGMGSGYALGSSGPDIPASP